MRGRDAVHLGFEPFGEKRPAKRDVTSSRPRAGVPVRAVVGRRVIVPRVPDRPAANQRLRRSPLRDARRSVAMTGFAMAMYSKSLSGDDGRVVAVSGMQDGYVACRDNLADS